MDLIEVERVLSEYAKLGLEYINSPFTLSSEISRFVDKSRAEEIIDLWLSTSFEEGRHQRRIEKLDS